MENEVQGIRAQLIDFISDKKFPCIGARASLLKQQLKFIMAGNMACPAHDQSILDQLYEFVDSFRGTKNNFSSAAILFSGPREISEETFEALMWQRLQALLDLDAENFSYDHRVSPDPSSPNFSFSLKEEAFFIVGLHPGSSRASRRFTYPVLIFNPHAQFVALKKAGKYESMKKAVRQKDQLFSGSVNPMLDDHGRVSEILQYSGRLYNEAFRCPLNIRHATR